MPKQIVDAITRRAAGVTRRHSLAALSGAGLSGLGGASSAAKGKPGKKARKRAKKKGKQKCKKQVGQCGEFVEDLCSSAQGTGRELCEARLTPCCDFLAQCQATSFFICIFENAA